MIVRRLPENSELYHHGIKGQRWYHRRFQNPDGSLTAAGRKRRGLIEQIKYNRRMKKVRKARVEKAKEKQRKAEELNAARQKAQAERKERAEIIKTGDAKQIQKIQSKMTPKEMQEALARVDFNKSLNEYNAAQLKAKAEKNLARLNTVMNVATTVGSIAQSAANVHESLTKMGIVKKKSSPLEALKNKKDILETSRDIKNIERNKELDEMAFKVNKEKISKELDDVKRNKTHERFMRSNSRKLEKAKLKADIRKFEADEHKNKRILDDIDLKNPNSIPNDKIDEILKLLKNQNN